MNGIVETLQLENTGMLQTFNQRPNVQFFEVTQVHSNIILTISESSTAAEFKLHKADGMAILFDHFHRALPCLAVKTADCLGVLAIGKVGIVLLHAGWRGLQSQILTQPLIHSIQPYRFHLTAHIQAQNYEVGAEFNDYFSHPNSLKCQDKKYFFSQKEEAHQQILNNWPKAQITSSQLNTFQDERLHSYRRQRATGSNYHLFTPQHVRN